MRQSTEVSWNPNGFQPGACGPSSRFPLTSLVIGNTDTSLYNIDPKMLWILDQELRYPSPVAKQLERQAEDAEARGAPVEKHKGWDGMIRLLRRPASMPPHFPTGLVAHVQRLLTKWGRVFEIDDVRTRPQEGLPEYPLSPIADRPYQIAAKDAAIRVGRGVLDMPPRSGKTRCAISIVAELGLTTIWIAPTDGIVRQTVRAFEEHLGPHFAMHQVGSKNLEKAINSRVIVCTAATAVRLGPEVYKSREVLFIDEMHHCSAKTYHEIAKMCDHIYYRFGMTGTFFRSGDDAMAMHALLSTTLFRITPIELRDKGYLVPARVVFIPVDASRLQCPSDDARIVPQLKYGIQDHNYRNGLVAYAAAMCNRVGRKVIVLVATKSQGNRMKQLIGDQLRPKADGAHFDPVEFLSTDRRRKTQQQILKAYNESNEVEILIGTSLVGEGIDLPPADAVIYARGEKAEVTLAQNTFRPLTAMAGKRDAWIIDFADRHNKMLMSHSKQRLAYFHNEPIFTPVEILPSIKNFGGWAKAAMAPTESAGSPL